MRKKHSYFRCGGSPFYIFQDESGGLLNTVLYILYLKLVLLRNNDSVRVPASTIVTAVSSLIMINHCVYCFSRAVQWCG